MKPAFVLGNGKSRLAVDLDTLKKYGLTYGCNALYRDFKPHVLVATDPGISNEIETSGYALHNTFYTRKPTIQLGSKPIEHHYGFSSGPVAAKLAANHGHKVIYLLGFDLIGDAGMQNNVYSGTANYRPKDHSATYYGNWVNQFTTIMSEHQSQMFVRVLPDDGMVPYQWLQMPNYRNQQVQQFWSDINNKPWQKPKELATDTQ
jgi:hypothetical protein